MHDISFESRTPTHYTAVIDGVAIEFSTAMNKISFGDCAALSEYVDCVEQHLANGLPLAPLSKQINGVNMLRLLEELFRNETIEYWLRCAAQNLAISTVKAFNNYFGFRHNATRYPSEFGAELVKLAVHNRRMIFSEEKRKVAESVLERKRISRRDQSLQNIVSKIDKNLFVNSKWIVEQYAYSMNVVLYRINGCQFSFCLTNHPALNSAKNVSKILSDLDDAFSSVDSSKIRAVIKAIGGKAAFQLMEAFFCDEAKQFFQSDFSEYVISRRVRPAPTVYMKTYFGGSCGQGHPYNMELLDTLEGCIPRLEKKLIDSSYDEIHKKTNEWKLFYYSRNQLKMNTLHFPESASIRDELQQYFIYLYNHLSASKEEPASLLNLYNISICTVIGKANRPIASVLELSAWDYRNIVLALSKEVSLQSVRKMMFHMRSLLQYLAPGLVETLLPLSIIPSLVLNPNKPVSMSVIKKIAARQSELPVYIWLAFQMFALTGARTGSVLDLVVDDLIEIDGEWSVRIYYGKAADWKEKSCTPSFVTHRLPHKFAQDLLQYIEDTAPLRDLITTNYIFVYTSSMFRQQTLRKPKILTSNAFSDALKKLCIQNEIYNEDGSVPNLSVQGIRAEVGRALFAKGASPETVAAKLGNTAPVAKRHYDSMYPADEASMRRELYAQTTDMSIDPTGTDAIFPFAKNDPMYGSCKKPGVCMNANNCRECTERILKK